MARDSEETTSISGEPTPVVQTTGPLVEGTSVGRYLVLERLGAGGMGEVYAAYDPELDRRVAIKLVHGELVSVAEGMQARLIREAQAMAKLSHPAVVAVYDAGVHGTRVYIAMEYVEGVTLKEWAAQRERSWREVLTVLLEAGRGLAAAHEEGIVHRDFKPGNVMVGQGERGEPRVRVLDFGLARRWDEDDDDIDASVRSVEPDGTGERSRRSGKLSTQLTRTGTVLGTPAYMAPEQFADRRIDAATDQFSFCVVAYRLIYGQPPFASNDYDDLSDRVMRGEVSPPPRTSAAPWALWPILHRGLQRAPEDRWPSLPALLERLERLLGASQRRLRAAAAVTVVGLVGTAVWVNGSDRPCEDIDTSMAGTWDAATKQRVQTSFDETGTVVAVHAWAAVEHALDTYASTHAAARQDACEATRVRGEQSTHLMDLRMACLDRRRVELDEMVKLFADADAEVVLHAVEAVGRLESISSCADVEALTAPVAPPPVERADEVAAAQRELARVRSLMFAGRFSAAEAPAQQLVERARTIDYDPLLSESLWLHGSVLERLARPQETASAYQEAVVAAARAGDRASEARALIGLVSVTGGGLGSHAEARRLAAHAEAMVDAIGGPVGLASTLALYRGNTEFGAGEFEAAATYFDQALQLADADPNGSRVQIAALNNLAGARSAQGRLADALEMFERALAIVERELGDAHPMVATHYNNLGITYLQQQRYDEALAAAEQAVQRMRAANGERNGDFARFEHNRGLVFEKLGRHAQALAAYQRAYEIKREVVGERASTTAFSANNIGTTLLAMGRTEEAIEWLGKALAIWEQVGDGDSADQLYALSSLAEAHLAAGDRARAMEFGQRGIALAETDGVAPADRAEMRFIMARVLDGAGRRGEARSAAEQARQAYAALERPVVDDLAAIDAWLRSHPG